MTAFSKCSIVIKIFFFYVAFLLVVDAVFICVFVSYVEKLFVLIVLPFPIPAAQFVPAAGISIPNGLDQPSALWRDWACG